MPQGLIVYVALDPDNILGSTKETLKQLEFGEVLVRHTPVTTSSSKYTQHHHHSMGFA
jgi:hypothetical protein